ncbi:MAG: HD domain-containing protein [Pseudomonadota bacterium]|nr:HD domain-containing protein [Pseudomonadota bacterium]
MQDTVAEITDFMQVIERVCLVKRDTLMTDGSTENDAAHIFKLAFLIMLVYPYLQKKYDYQRLLELALVHDIAEGITGDCPRSAQVAHPERRLEKEKQERAAMELYQKMLPPPLNKKIFELFSEYEARRTPEAKLVSVLDKMEANLQANRFGNGDIRYWTDCENGDEYYRIATAKKSLVAELDEKILTILEKNIIDLTLENMAKCNIKVSL